MPELPEVETTRLGISPHIQNKAIAQLTLRQRRLRWPVPSGLEKRVKGQTVKTIQRRGKYLLFELSSGALLWHLGMSGNLRIVEKNTPPKKHDHVDLCMRDGTLMRFHDPRRFGALLWSDYPFEAHPLLAHLGPEPLTEDFNADYLFARSRHRRQAVKSWIMDAKVVVGVGNIYANEALFYARVHPLKAAGKLTRKQCECLVAMIKSVLTQAITRGGTTLRDFVGGDGKPGYFAQELAVYGRGALPCKTCDKPLLEKRVAQRSTVYCTRCQN